MSWIKVRVWFKNLGVIRVFVLGTVLYFIISVVGMSTLYYNYEVAKRDGSEYRDTIMFQAKQLYKLADTKRDSSLNNQTKMLEILIEMQKGK